MDVLYAEGLGYFTQALKDDPNLKYIEGMGKYEAIQCNFTWHELMNYIKETHFNFALRGMSDFEHIKTTKMRKTKGFKYNHVFYRHY